MPEICVPLQRERITNETTKLDQDFRKGRGDRPAWRRTWPRLLVHILLDERKEESCIIKWVTVAYTISMNLARWPRLQSSGMNRTKNLFLFLHFRVNGHKLLLWLCVIREVGSYSILIKSKSRSQVKYETVKTILQLRSKYLSVIRCKHLVVIKRNSIYLWKYVSDYQIAKSSE